MNKLVLSIAVVLALAPHALASPTVGDLVSYRTATSQHNLAVVGRVVSGSTVDIVAFSDGTNWQDGGTPWGVATITYPSVALGTGVGQYQPTTIIADIATAAGFVTSGVVTSAITSATSGLASTSYVGSAVAGLASASYVDGLGPTYLALPPAPASGGMSLGGSGVQLSATRPVLLTIRGSATMTSTLAGGQAYTVELRCDSGATPTTVVDDAGGSINQQVGLSVTLTEIQPWKLVTMARAGDKCRVVQAAGAATLSLTGSSAQPL